MAETGSCEVKRIQLNSAQSAFDTARQARDQNRTAYLQCQGPSAVNAAAVSDAQGEISQIRKEGEELLYMHEFLLKQLGREAARETTYQDLESIVGGEAAKLNDEIEHLKSEIRTERRRFLDADPSVSPAVAGLYFTRTPDNQVLITFLVGFGAFLLFSGALILMDLIPLAYFNRMTGGERLKIVGGYWLVSLLLAYTGLYMFS
jgi:hypothetical protein